MVAEYGWVVGISKRKLIGYFGGRWIWDSIYFWKSNLFRLFHSSACRWWYFLFWLDNCFIWLGQIFLNVSFSQGCGTWIVWSFRYKKFQHFWITICSVSCWLYRKFYILCGYQMMYFDTSGAFSLGVKVRFLSLLILFGIIISEW